MLHVSHTPTPQQLPSVEVLPPEQRRADRQLKIRLLQAEVVETLLMGAPRGDQQRSTTRSSMGPTASSLHGASAGASGNAQTAPSYAKALIQAGCEENHRGPRAQTGTVFRGLCYAHGGQPPPQAHAVRSDGGGRGIPGRAGEGLGVSSI
ncbi:unnamed protein product [Ectocarpus sp. CCAP 1310/34]|nr:unnamed protein product [Ectocarpus sp. CCAP 1310/34]